LSSIFINTGNGHAAVGTGFDHVALMVNTPEVSVEPPADPPPVLPVVSLTQAVIDILIVIKARRIHDFKMFITCDFN